MSEVKEQDDNIEDNFKEAREYLLEAWNEDYARDNNEDWHDAVGAFLKRVGKR